MSERDKWAHELAWHIVGAWIPIPPDERRYDEPLPEEIARLAALIEAILFGCSLISNSIPSE